jgi:transposase
MDVVMERCAGIDVHKDTVVTCVRTPGADGQREVVIKIFGTVTTELLGLRDWLVALGVTLVGMESTGVYWRPVVRHEALFDREGMKGPLLRAVAAA